MENNSQGGNTFQAAAAKTTKQTTEGVLSSLEASQKTWLEIVHVRTRNCKQTRTVRWQKGSDRRRHIKYTLMAKALSPLFLKGHNNPETLEYI